MNLLASGFTKPEFGMNRYYPNVEMKLPEKTPTGAVARAGGGGGGSSLSLTFRYRTLIILNYRSKTTGLKVDGQMARKELWHCKVSGASPKSGFDCFSRPQLAGGHSRRKAWASELRDVSFILSVHPCI